jgi:hypothetical protein
MKPSQHSPLKTPPQIWYCGYPQEIPQVPFVFVVEKYGSIVETLKGKGLRNIY